MTLSSNLLLTDLFERVFFRASLQFFLIKARIKLLFCNFFVPTPINIYVLSLTSQLFILHMYVYIYIYIYIY